MKRIYIAVVFLLTAGITAAVEIGYVSAEADYYIARINSIDKQMKKDDFQSVIEQCAEINDEWDKTAKSFDLFLIHDYVDSVETSISKMLAYAENGSVDMYFSESTEAKKELSSIKESEFAMPENIF